MRGYGAACRGLEVVDLHWAFCARQSTKPSGSLRGIRRFGGAVLRLLDRLKSISSVGESVRRRPTHQAQSRVCTVRHPCQHRSPYLASVAASTISEAVAPVGSSGPVGTLLEASLATLDEAAALGVTMLDTAERYAAGSSESMIGRWLAERDRSVADLVRITTNVAPPGMSGRDDPFDGSFI